MAGISDSGPFPQNPSDTEPTEFVGSQAVLGLENHIIEPLYTNREVRNQPGNVIQEPLLETVEESQRLPRDKSKYWCERERLKTFVTWTHFYRISPHHLAKNGFIYIGPEDKVMCVFCFTSKSDWKSGDNVQSGHDPECPFMKGGCSEVNRPIFRQPILLQYIR